MGVNYVNNVYVFICIDGYMWVHICVYIVCVNICIYIYMGMRSV